jgi:hypothetical protein
VRLRGGPLGGLPRRATYLAKARKPGDLLIDLGNLIEGIRPHERLKLSYILEGLKQLDYDLLVPGRGNSRSPRTSRRRSRASLARRSSAPPSHPVAPPIANGVANKEPPRG